MQAHQMCETLEEKEHRRWLAHRDAVLSANFPTHLDLNGLTVPIFKAGELEALGQKRLKERALNLRDLVEASRTRLFDDLPRLGASPSAPRRSSVRIVMAALHSPVAQIAGVI